MNLFPENNQEESLIHPVVEGSSEPATMSNLMMTSSLWRQRTFRLREERLTQSPIVLGKAYQA